MNTSAITADKPTSGVAFFYSNAAATLFVGNITNYAFVIYAHDLTVAKSYAGFVYFATFAAAAIFSLQAGTLLDRFDRLRIVLLFQPFYVVTLFATALMSGFNISRPLQMAILPLLGFVNGTCLAFLLPGRFALLASILPGNRLEKGTMILNVILIASFGAAPFLFGLLKSASGWPWIFVLLSALYAAGGLSLLGLSRKHMQGTATSSADKKNGPGIRDALIHVVRADPTLGALLLLNAAGQLALGPIIVLFPQFLTSALGMSEIGRGIAIGGVGAGLLAGGILAAWKGAGIHRGRSLTVCLAAVGFALMGVSVTSRLSVAMILLIALGVTCGIFGTLLPSLIQARAPDQTRGRILSLYSIACQIAPAASGLFCGIMADIFGIRTAIFMSGLFILAGGFAVVARHAHIRDYR